MVEPVTRAEAKKIRENLFGKQRKKKGVEKK